VILTAGIDLAVAANAALAGSIVGTLTVNSGVSPLLGILIGLALATAVGCVNGILVAWAGLPPFIVTLAGLSLWRGIALQTTKGFDTSPMPKSIEFLGSGHIGGVPVPVLIFGATVVVAAFVLRYTRLGRYTYLIGSNEEAARLVGIPVRRYKIGVYLVSGLCAGLAAIVLVGRLDSSGGTLASGLELDSIAAVVLGGTSLFGGRGGVIGSALGAVFMATMRNGMDLLGLSAFWQMIVLGLVILAAISTDVVRLKLRGESLRRRAVRLRMERQA
jgi:ribose transport system permease protein